MKRVLLGGFLVMTMGVRAQNRLESDRPGETMGPRLVQQGTLQLEAGVQKSQGGGEKRYLHPESTLRLGMLPWLELRAQADVETERSPGGSRHGLKPLEIGLKTQILEGAGQTLSVSLLTMAGIPNIASPDRRVPHVAPEVRLLAQNKPLRQVELDYNLGVEWEGDGSTPEWMYAFSPHVELSKQWQLFTEAFGFFRKGEKPRHQVDAGFEFDPAPNIRLDFTAGKGLSSGAPDYFLGVGITIRFGQ
ncbi:MAG TPA: transporter [Chitinophagaceae bacterium]|jgi:hypothetical protein|nr:transporter [Chitinophagaceae bacterium]